MLDPSAFYNPYLPYGPAAGLFSPFSQYFTSPTSAGLSLAPYSQQAWYAFQPWSAGAGLGMGGGAWPWSTLYPTASGFANAPATPPAVPTPMGPATDAPLPPVPTTFTPTGGAGPAAGGGGSTVTTAMAPAAAGITGPGAGAARDSGVQVMGGGPVSGPGSGQRTGVDLSKPGTWAYGSPSFGLQIDPTIARAALALMGMPLISAAAGLGGRPAYGQPGGAPLTGDPAVLGANPAPGPGSFATRSTAGGRDEDLGGPPDSGDVFGEHGGPRGGPAY